ncbi:MAG: thiamine pyrophosphate-binding protein, partial [Candidatus Nanopelagicales bacterium]
MNPSTAQGRVVVDELIRCGVTDVVLAPGSRSAPFALALAAADARGLVRLHVRLDERSAGFLAVGLAQVSGRAAVVVTTSGTAVANLTPAMVEASYAGVPIIAITADRPPELRDTGANQSIDQVKAFGTLVRWSHDLAVAEPRIGQVGYWRSVIDRAVDSSIEGVDPGPVHVNVALRVPLTPQEDDPGWVENLGLLPGDFDPDDLPDVLPHTVDGRLALSAAQPLDEVLAPFVSDDLAITELFRTWGTDHAMEDFTGQINDLLQRISADVTAVGDADEGADDEDADNEDEEDDGQGEGDYEDDAGAIVPSRGVVVVGHGGDLEQGDAAIALAEACGWPLIGEPTGNARTGDTTLTHGPILLADKDFADEHQPDVAVVVGTVGLERSVLDLISRTPLVVTVDPRVAVRRADP